MLNNPTPEEKRALSGFLGKDYSKSKSIKLTAEKMEKAILKTKYGKTLESVSFQDILEAYHGEPLVSHREEERLFLTERKAYFDNLERGARSPLFIALIDWIRGTKHNRFYQMYNHERAALTKAMGHLNQAFALFPLASYEYLAVFSSNATGNPHAFDANENEGKLFIYALQIIHSLESDWEIKELNAEERAELLYEFNIMTDDLLNFVSVFHASGKNKNGNENRLLYGAVQEKAFFHLPLKEIVKLGSVTSASGKNRLFMIENSSVASHVVSELLRYDINETIISGNGQFKIATLKFLDAFVKNGGAIYYSGDFDPEGILMAYKLRKRYGDSLHYWHYDVNHYHMALSQEPISARRLKQLNSIDDPALQPLIDEIKEIKQSGYQEKMLLKIVEDLKKVNE
ncbi:TIGR02679 domain-containing protein [Lederbergia sp. NSJ-179]|uniref:TIGR02679 domain-containing protein n=1 Tax=Lederbergia sp. NSJ-179 TaxID=2931402 RepID=UPI001FD06189|nr:TIGR02679 domain-containing protein [Lederbergia sp. NSJ-179]MCJ7843350.1 TIGR02679 domain-containing protein [Lederbergia sp. NSJ-179]